MEPEARYTLVGAALVLLVTAMALGMVWLARTGDRADFRFFTIYFERQSLEGLQVGGDVTMRGIKIGRVEDYAISPDNINRVKVRIRVDRNIPVSDNTTAVVARNFVTGLARINLETPDKPGPELTTAPDGERYPVIGEGESSLAQLADTASRLSVRANDALEGLSRVLTPENSALFAQVLVNLRDVAGGLNARLGSVDRSAAAIDRAAADFRVASRAFTSAVERVSGDFQPLAKQTEATLQDLSSAVKAVERDANMLARRLDDVADSTGIEVRVMAQQIRASADLLAGALDRFQDPRATFLGAPASALGPGESAR